MNDGAYRLGSVQVTPIEKLLDRIFQDLDVFENLTHEEKYMIWPLLSLKRLLPLLFPFLYNSLCLWPCAAPAEARRRISESYLMR